MGGSQISSSPLNAQLSLPTNPSPRFLPLAMQSYPSPQILPHMGKSQAFFRKNAKLSFPTNPSHSMLGRILPHNAELKSFPTNLYFFFSLSFSLYLFIFFFLLCFIIFSYFLSFFSIFFSFLQNLKFFPKGKNLFPSVWGE